MGAESSSMQNVSTCRGCKDYGNKTTDTVKVDLDRIGSGKENNGAPGGPVAMTKETAAQRQERLEQEKQAQAEAEARRAEELKERLRRLEEQKRAEEEAERQRLEEEERQRQVAEARRQEEERKAIAAEQARRAAEAARKEQARIAEQQRMRAAEEERLRKIAEEEARQRAEEEERQRQQFMAMEQKKARRLQEFLEDTGFQTKDEKKVKKSMLSSTFYYPLHAAVEAKDVEAVELLIWAGVNTQIQNSKKQTPLELAQAKNKKGSHNKVILALSQGKRGSVRTGGA